MKKIPKTIDSKWVREFISGFDFKRDSGIMLKLSLGNLIKVLNIIAENKIEVPLEFNNLLFMMAETEEQHIYDIPELEVLNYNISETGKGDAYEVLKFRKLYVVTYSSDIYPNRIYTFNIKMGVEYFLKKRVEKLRGSI